MDSLNLTTTEKAIIKNRSSGKPFVENEGNDRRHFLDQIIARISASTGCELPGTDFFASILCEEIEGVMIDFGYDILTLSEVVFAIRLNSKPSEMKMPSGIELEPITFSGRTVNSYFLSKIISNYMIVRNLFDRKLQNFLDGY